jgi:hypothetical protein
MHLCKHPRVSAFKRPKRADETQKVQLSADEYKKQKNKKKQQKNKKNKKKAMAATEERQSCPEENQ